LALASKNIKDPLAAKAEWEQILAPFGVRSARELSAGVAKEFIKQVGKLHDPFGHPATEPSKI
jgi:hypothetical protein